MFGTGRRHEDKNNDAQVYVETHPVSFGRSKLQDGEWKSKLSRWRLEEQYCGK